MNIKLKFKNINHCNGIPTVKIAINDAVLYAGEVQPIISLDFLDSEQNFLVIEHYGKNPNTDCRVVDGVIVQDKNCELSSIEIDSYDIEELKWNSVYVTEDQETLDKCLFFGKNGRYSLQFTSPVLKWILSTRHEMNNNDPYWEEDYESYMSACKLLSN